MSDATSKRLDAIEQKAFDDFDAAVPDASRFGRAGAGIIARQVPAYVRQVATLLVDEIERLTAQRNAAVKAYVKRTDGNMPTHCDCCGGESLCDGCEPGCALSDAIEAVFPGATR